MYKYILALAICFLLVAGLASPGQCQIKECRQEFSIDYVGMWSEYYDACHPEMRTIFDYHVVGYGGYGIIWAQVDNTPFSVYYDASLLCPEPPCYGSDSLMTHCEELEDHRLIMDVQTSENWGFDEYQLTAQYFLSKPD
jgi:hypothetical protein